MFLFQIGIILPIILAFGALASTLSLPETHFIANSKPSKDPRSKVSKEIYPPQLHNVAMAESFPMSSALLEGDHLQNEKMDSKRATSLLKSSVRRHRRRAASSGIRCDKILKIERNCDGTHMVRYDCNSCKDSKGNHLKCQPKYVETRILKFLGTSNGNPVCRYEVRKIPVLCECS